jgi:hypothetical protein
MSKLLIDNCSILDFFKFYTFDKNHEKNIFQKLVNFLKKKIQNDEIIVIDKVYNELKVGHWYPEMRDFKRQIKNKVVDTTNLLIEVDELTQNYFIEENKIRFFRNEKGYVDENRVRVALDRYLDEHADLYLIAYCKNLKENGDKAIIITEESTKSDNKLIEKIPVICKKEKIEFFTIPHSLFEIYRNELKFQLN